MNSPALSSLGSALPGIHQSVRRVPPLAGPQFDARWQDNTVAQAIVRFQEAIGAFPPEGMTGETTVQIAAYALQASGAKPGEGPLTRSTAVTLGAVIR